MYIIQYDLLKSIVKYTLIFFTKTDLSYFVTMDRPRVGGETAFHLRKPNN